MRVVRSDPQSRALDILRLRSHSRQTALFSPQTSFFAHAPSEASGSSPPPPPPPSASESESDSSSASARKVSDWRLTLAGPLSVTPCVQQQLPTLAGQIGSVPDGRKFVRTWLSEVLGAASNSNKTRNNKVPRPRSLRIAIASKSLL